MTSKGHAKKVNQNDVGVNPHSGVSGLPSYDESDNPLKTNPDMRVSGKS